LHAEGVPDQLAISVGRVEFQRALVNLINNALEATVRTSSPKIDVYLRFQNQRCSISISDNGLGLHYAKTLFESVGGRLEIQSKVGVGTLVSIEVPALG